MKMADKVGGLGATLFVFAEALALTHLENGRLAQGCALLQFVSLGFFLYAGSKGSRWWFAALAVLLVVEGFWISRT